MADSPPKVTFHYIKAPYYVEAPVHGAYGGINTANGLLYMAVYSERSPIPQEVIVNAPQDGGLVDFHAAEKRGKDGVIRVVSSVMHFDINTAMSLHKWLGDKIDQFREAHPDLFEAAKEGSET
jgi:hypothetical protein